MPGESPFADTVILITKEGIGSAEAPLQRKLLDTYLRVLVENPSLPAIICFYTDGVKLVIEGSQHLERLSQLEKAGVRLIACSTCLDYFGLTDKIRVGVAGGMPDIIAAQARASKVITL
jgi:intracellular sulfur oxidation DsrE/DsrF family protein